MKYLIYLLVPLALFSCKQHKEKTEAQRHAEFTKRALESDEYKDARLNVKRVNDALDSIKKGRLDSNVAIYEYNNSIADRSNQVKTLTQVAQNMKNDTTYLKAILSRLVSQMAAADSVDNHR